MPPRRRKGDRRIDAAIDHFGAMGYAARDVRSAVKELLKVYGGPAAWPLLEEASYNEVQNKLFEMEEEEKQRQNQLLLEYRPEQEQVEEGPTQQQVPAVDELLLESNMSVLEVYNDVRAEAELTDGKVEGAQQQERAVDEAAPVTSMSILEEYNEVPADAELADDELDESQQQESTVGEAPENNMAIIEVPNEVPAEAESTDEEVQDPMFIEPPALEAEEILPAATRPPCYGWISESEGE
uniref:WIYLD domain-containing protein n=1 Tax=Arundo donax TaxID=35708 RepID=A0A0A8YL49_ARUDO